MANSLDATTLVNIAKNRGRLLRLTEGFKGHRPNKKCLRLDPAYTGNIQHLVFGTYRSCANTPPPQEGAGVVDGRAPSDADGSAPTEMPLTTWREVEEKNKPPFRKAHSLSEKRKVTCQIRVTPPPASHGRVATTPPPTSQHKFVNNIRVDGQTWPCAEESPLAHESKPLLSSPQESPAKACGEGGRRNSEPRLSRHLGSSPDVRFRRLHSSRATDGMLHKFRRSVAIVMRPKEHHRGDNSKCHSADSGILVESSATRDDSTSACVATSSRPLSESSKERISAEDISVQRIGEDSVLRRTPSVGKIRSKPAPLRRHQEASKIRRSLSQPLDLERLALRHRRERTEHSSDDDLSSDDSLATPLDRFPSTAGLERRDEEEDEARTVTYAEALWDHVTIDAEELAFKAGQVIEVTDTGDSNWWWGSILGRSGWFPAAFVRLRVSQDDTVEDCIVKMAEGTLLMRQAPRKLSVSLLSNEQVRANIVREIVATERDFVRHLRNLVEGYLQQVLRRTDMFTPEQVWAIFGNIEEIYRFQSTFLRRLESAICWEAPQSSQIGRCFLDHKDKFRIYSEYCNNHPLAVSQLQELYADAKYIHFFEACRLLQQMIDISLDGFLLTPVQKICKYPLQLGELLKYTPRDHPDYRPVAEALREMRGVAQLVNERKRRLECLEKLAEWQRSVDAWEGPEILETSSVLIHSGEVTRVTSNWSRDLSLFLFDHLLVYCKKDLLKRNSCVYKGRINVDCCCIFDVEDGKDAQFGVGIRNGWKVYCAGRDKWFLFYAKTPVEKRRWLLAFREERQHVRDDREQGFQVSSQDKKVARASVLNRLKPKRPRAKVSKGHPDTAVVGETLPDNTPCSKTRSGSLPSNLNPSVVVVSPTGKKKGSGWFHFGSGKKVMNNHHRK